jgi:hypothetical protein
VPHAGGILLTACQECAKLFVRTYGYRWITGDVAKCGLQVGRERVQRIWWREGLKIPAKQDRWDDCN